MDSKKTSQDMLSGHIVVATEEIFRKKNHIFEIDEL